MQVAQHTADSLARAGQHVPLLDDPGYQARPLRTLSQVFCAFIGFR